MNILDWLLKRPKPLYRMTAKEIRKREIRASVDTERVMRSIEKLAADKKKIFERGSSDPTPEMRRMLAQQFELKTTEQLMLSRELNTRSKEHLLMARMRMIKQSHERAKAAGSRVGEISEADVAKLTAMVDQDSITAEMYNERLDRALAVGAEADEGMLGISEAAQAVMRTWERVDNGALTDTDEAFDEADRSVREAAKE